MKTIGIYTPSIPNLKPWDPDSIKTGIGGSEESVIYAASALAKLGHRVIVLNNAPPNSKHSHPEANPRYIAETDAVFDIAIICRTPQLGMLARGAKRILWPQDTWERPLSNQEIDLFDDVLWISNWQREQWISKNPRFAKYTSIFGNGLDPKPFGPITQRKNPYSCIYASNYGRGLEVLLDVWPEVKRRFPKAHLDIYYGWKHWGILSKPQEDLLRQKLEKLEPFGVKELGLVGHETLAIAFGKASFWTYPCIKDETFCITATKAQLAGAVPVIIEGSALKETVRHGFKCGAREEYLGTLLGALERAQAITLNQRKEMGQFVLHEFIWEKIVAEWCSKTFDSRIL